MTYFHQNTVIPDFYTTVHIHPCFALLALKSDECAPKHGYSLFLCKSWQSSMLCTLDAKKWRILHQNMVIPEFCANMTFIDALHFRL